MADDSGREQREVYFRGRVQGVGFRYTTREIARQYEVTGYVRNLPDGRVIVVAEGAVDELERFFGAIRSQLGRHIRDTAQIIRPANGQFEQFEIRH